LVLTTSRRPSCRLQRRPRRVPRFIHRTGTDNSTTHNPLRVTPKRGRAFEAQAVVNREVEREGTDLAGRRTLVSVITNSSLHSMPAYLAGPRGRQSRTQKRWWDRNAICCLLAQPEEAIWTQVGNVPTHRLYQACSRPRSPLSRYSDAEAIHLV
jgi:hypothetical protein